MPTMLMIHKWKYEMNQSFQFPLLLYLYYEKINMDQQRKTLHIETKILLCHQVDNISHYSLSFDCIYNCNTAITKQRHDKQVKYKFIYMRKPDLGNQQDQQVMAHLNQALLCLSRNDQKEPVYNIRLRS